MAKIYKWGFDLTTFHPDALAEVLEKYGLELKKHDGIWVASTIAPISVNVFFGCNPLTGEHGCYNQAYDKGYAGYVGIEADGAHSFVTFLEDIYECIEDVKGMGGGVSPFCRSFI